MREHFWKSFVSCSSRYVLRRIVVIIRGSGSKEICLGALIVKPRTSYLELSHSVKKGRPSSLPSPRFSRRARRASCVRRTYKNRTLIRARTGTGITPRVHERFDEWLGRTYDVRESHTRVGARKVCARVRRCSLAFRSCYYASACAPRCMKRFPDLLFQPPFSTLVPLLLPFPRRVFPPPGKRTRKREERRDREGVV